MISLKHKILNTLFIKNGAKSKKKYFGLIKNNHFCTNGAACKKCDFVLIQINYFVLMVPWYNNNSSTISKLHM